jgi:hypothetical protein
MVDHLGGVGAGCSQSDVLGWYAAFLHNAGDWVGGGPRAVLWAGIERSYRTRGVVAEGFRGRRVGVGMRFRSGGLGGMGCPDGMRGSSEAVVAGWGAGGWDGTRWRTVDREM